MMTDIHLASTPPRADSNGILVTRLPRLHDTYRHSGVAVLPKTFKNGYDDQARANRASPRRNYFICRGNIYICASADNYVRYMPHWHSNVEYLGQ